MKKILFLKDIEFSEIESVLSGKLKLNFEDVDIIRHSDFYAGRKKQIKIIRQYKSDVFILGIYKNEYLKWSIVFRLFVYLSGAKECYILDTNGTLEKVNFISVLKHSILATFSLVGQLLYIVRLPLTLFSHIENNKKVLYNKSDVLNIAYLRTTDTYNLVAGGSLGHTVGIIEGFKKIVKRIDFFGIDNIKSIDETVKKNIIAPSLFFNYVVIFNRYIYSCFFVKKIKNNFEDRNFDLIYQRLSRDNIAGAVLSQKYEIPLIIEFNSFMKWEVSSAENILEKLFLKITNSLERISLNQASLIIAVSDVLKNDLVKEGYEENKILVAYNGVNTDRFISNDESAFKKVLGIPNDILVVGFSGTFGFWHGIDILEDAMELVNKSNVKCYFLLIGDGYYRKKMEEKFKGCKNVIFTNKVPYSEIVSYLSVCDIFVSPHAIKNNEKFIGSPTKLFEYLSMGKITIATDLDQIADIVSPSMNVNEVNGIYEMNCDVDTAIGIKVKQGDAKQLAFAIAYAIENFDKLSYLGVNARQKAIKEYTWDSVTEKILDKLYMMENNVK